MRKILAALTILPIAAIAANDLALESTIKARNTLKRLSSPTQLQCPIPATVPYLVDLPAPKGFEAIYTPSSQTIQTTSKSQTVILHETFHHLTARMSAKCQHEIMVEALTILATEGSEL